MLKKYFRWLSRQRGPATSTEQWNEAQSTNLRWYTERMFKPKINAWDPLLDFFSDRLQQPDKVLLEVGPGPTGGMLKFMTGKRKIGIEPLAQAYSDNGFLGITQGDIFFLNCLGETTPLVAESVDIGLCIHSLGHAQHPYEILEELDRLLAYSGEIWILDFLRSEKQTTPDHPVALSQRDLDQWFGKHGYREKKKDISRNVQENDLSLPVYYAIFSKFNEAKTYSEIIDFSISKFDVSIHGGWYHYETDGRPARWVSDMFQAYLGRNFEAKTLFLEGYCLVDHFPNKSLRVSMEADGVDLGGREISETGPFLLSWPLPSGKSTKIKVVGRCSDYFVPDQVLSNGDDRELSIMVFRFGVE